MQICIALVQFLIAALSTLAGAFMVGIGAGHADTRLVSKNELLEQELEDLGTRLDTLQLSLDALAIGLGRLGHAFLQRGAGQLVAATRPERQHEEIPDRKAVVDGPGIDAFSILLELVGAESRIGIDLVDPQTLEVIGPLTR